MTMQAQIVQVLCDNFFIEYFFGAWNLLLIVRIIDCVWIAKITEEEAELINKEERFPLSEVLTRFREAD